MDFVSDFGFLPAIVIDDGGSCFDIFLGYRLFYFNTGDLLACSAEFFHEGRKGADKLCLSSALCTEDFLER